MCYLIEAAQARVALGGAGRPLRLVYTCRCASLFKYVVRVFEFILSHHSQGHSTTSESHSSSSVPESDESTETGSSPSSDLSAASLDNLSISLSLSDDRGRLSAANWPTFSSELNRLSSSAGLSTCSSSSSTVVEHPPAGDGAAAAPGAAAAGGEGEGERSEPSGGAGTDGPASRPTGPLSPLRLRYGRLSFDEPDLLPERGLCFVQGSPTVQQMVAASGKRKGCTVVRGASYDAPGSANTTASLHRWLPLACCRRAMGSAGDATDALGFGAKLPHLSRSTADVFAAHAGDAA